MSILGALNPIQFASHLAGLGGGGGGGGGMSSMPMGGMGMGGNWGQILSAHAPPSTGPAPSDIPGLLDV